MSRRTISRIKGAWVLAVLLLTAQAAAAQPIRISVPEYVYADLAQQVGGPMVAVTLLDREKTMSNGAAALSQTDLVLCSRAKVDAWLVEAARQLPAPPVVLEALSPTSNQIDHEFPWYDTRAMSALTQNLAAELTHRIPAEAPRIAANLARTQESFRAIDRKFEEIAKTYAGSDILVADALSRSLIQRLRFKITDEAYVNALQRGGAPSATSLAALRGAIQRRKGSIFVYDQDAASPAVKELVAEANDNAIPVVGLRETMPKRLHYQQWMLRELSAVHGALNQAAP